MSSDTKAPPILKRKSDRAIKTSTQVETLLSSAKDKANNVVHSAREWLTPSTESLTQLESLSTVMFSPIAAHPVYRSEAMVKAIQLMQQQQQRSAPNSNALITPPRDLVLQGKSYAWPSSSVLLQADIPESNHPVSLFQGFASTYPSLAKSSSVKTSKRSRQRKKKQANEDKDPRGNTYIRLNFLLK